MKIQKEIFFLFIVTVFDRFQFCFSNLQSFFRMELKDTAMDNNTKPIFNESTTNEVECYIKCLDNRGKCCLLQMKEKLDKVSCLLYATKFSDAVFRSDTRSKISSVVGCELPKDCKELYEQGHTKDGVYDISINGINTKVLCDMTTDGGGWTILQRRIDGSVDFERTWDEYKNGFGTANGEYWLGNERIHQMTNRKSGALIKIEGMDFRGVRKHIIMKGFWIENESSKYRLHAGTFVYGEQNLVNDWIHHDEQFFSTKDQDNDLNPNGSCGKTYGNGWWYRECYHLNLNGKYSNTGTIDKYYGILWDSWTGDFKGLKLIKMQLK